jgi:hypothetical protein
MFLRSDLPYISFCIWQIPANVIYNPDVCFSFISFQSRKSSIDKEPYQYFVIKKQQQL